jgi:hypothetical protein
MYNAGLLLAAHHQLLRDEGMSTTAAIALYLLSRHAPPHNKP